jgi:hypothetical protein
VLLPALPVLLIQLAGVVVAAIVLARRRSTSAILALAGFGVMFVVGRANLARPALVSGLSSSGLGSAGLGGYLAIQAGVGCCCSLFDVAALVCLIVALWRGLGPDQAASNEAFPSYE